MTGGELGVTLVAVKLYKKILIALIPVFFLPLFGCSRNSVRIGGEGDTPLKLSSDSLYIDPASFGVENVPNISIDTSWSNDISIEVARPSSQKTAGETGAF